MLDAAHDAGEPSSTGGGGDDTTVGWWTGEYIEVFCDAPRRGSLTAFACAKDDDWRRHAPEANRPNRARYVPIGRGRQIILQGAAL